ncbi:hypothetical protein J3R30DRAFT_3694605 [Lentinula aciculospora]|uniref:Uncharacterized protein n=1 Tax=Lentinula aciculospora TaxID=153920 RepID=A0A9W9AUQ3_9AGAR|nr:hypothetical protein J3R30DRAFT_3694605 [Lentinula aciculospora]
MAVPIRSFSTWSSSHLKLPSMSPAASAKVTASDAVLSPTTVYRVDYYKRSDANASSMLMQSIFPQPPPSRTHYTYEPTNSQTLLYSCHRHISENRALATWICLIIIKHKLVMEDPGIVFDELELLHEMTYKLTKSFQLLNPPTPLIFIALLYLYRIFPNQIPYSGNPDHECATAVQRLFLLCLRLALQWFEDQSEFWDFRARHFKWHEHLDLEQFVFRNADIHALHLLGHNLCISNIAYARWLSHLSSNLPVFLGNHVDEHRVIVRLIHAVRPFLTPGFLSPNSLPCSGLPFDKGWTPALSCMEEFVERGQGLMDCITYGLYVPLYTAPTSTNQAFHGDFTVPEPTISVFLDADWIPGPRSSGESSTTSIDTNVTSPDIARLHMQCNLWPETDINNQEEGLVNPPSSLEYIHDYTRRSVARLRMALPGFF